jgi:predicted permease
VADAARLLFSIFASDILPIFLVAGVGFLLARYTGADVRSLSRVTFYALAPCLVFTLLATSSLGGLDFGRMALFSILVTAAAGVMARLAGAALRLDRPTLIAFLLVVMFSNGGNYGLPVALFAFGREGLTHASVYFVTGAVLTYTAGIVLAASGRHTVMQALAGVGRVPAIYGALAAGAVAGMGVQIPEAVMRPVTILSDASLPLMILVLGMQLERATLPERPAVVLAAVALSLLVTPTLAFGIAKLVGLSGPAFQAGVLQAAMPTAVVTTILALEFEVAPSFVTSVVFVSTLVSPLTLTVLIAYLQKVG